MVEPALVLGRTAGIFRKKVMYLISIIRLFAGFIKMGDENILATIEEAEKAVPLWIGGKEAAEFLGCSVSYAYRVIRECNKYIKEKGGIVPIQGKTNRLILKKLVMANGEEVIE